MDKASSNVSGKGEKSYITWTVQMDTVLSNTLVEQHNMGRKTPNGWKAVAFTAAIAALKEACNVDVSKEKIMARLKTWNKYYQEVSAMLETSGFGWDWERNIVKVDSEDVWENYVKAHPGVRHYRGKVIINWIDLGTICGHDRATGSHAATFTESVNELESNSVAAESETPRHRSMFEGEGSRQTRKKRAVGVDALAKAISTVAASLNRSNDIDAVTEDDQAVMRGQKVYAEISKLNDLDRHEKLRACNLLNSDRSKFGMFMALPDDMKTSWIKMHFYE